LLLVEDLDDSSGCRGLANYARLEHDEDAVVMVTEEDVPASRWWEED